MKNSRLRWIGHVLRMPMDRLPKFALRCTPTEKGKRGLSKNTWRRTVMKELEEVGLTWSKAQAKGRGASQS